MISSSSRAEACCKGIFDLYYVLQNTELIRKLEAMAAKKVTLQI